MYMDEIIKVLDQYTKEEVIKILVQYIKESTDDSLLTRKEVTEKYGLTIKGTARLFNELKGRHKLVYLGKEQKVSKKLLESIFQKGITLKE